MELGLKLVRAWLLPASKANRIDSMIVCLLLLLPQSISNRIEHHSVQGSSITTLYCPVSAFFLLEASPLPFLTGNSSAAVTSAL